MTYEEWSAMQGTGSTGDTDAPLLPLFREDDERNTLEQLRLDDEVAALAQATGVSMLELVRELYPITRSITGPGLRATVRRLSEIVPLKITEVPTGMRVFDWTIPDEWCIEEAYIEHESGQRFADLRQCNLHVVNYSVPVETSLTLSELRPHLHSIPEHPDWIPYRTSYYQRDWGFCLADRQLRSLPEGRYRVLIKSTLAPGALTLAEYLHRGAIEDEILVFAHDCHPSLANDNLSGVAVAVHLAAFLRTRKTRYSYRFLFCPTTIGSVAWLALNQAHLGRIRHGLVLALLGDSGPLQYKKSRSGDRPIDRVSWHVLRNEFPGAQLRGFAPWGYDERQFCSPGINLPVGRLTRTPNGEFDEYHTSADNPDLLSAASLGGAWLACVKIFEALEADRRYINLSPMGEPQLGSRGLYRAMGGHRGIAQQQLALLWMLNQSDGGTSVLDIAERSNLPINLLADAALASEKAGLLARTGPGPEFLRNA